jgi:hypothetical protein
LVPGGGFDLVCWNCGINCNWWWWSVGFLGSIIVPFEGKEAPQVNSTLTNRNITSSLILTDELLVPSLESWSVPLPLPLLLLLLESFSGLSNEHDAGMKGMGLSSVLAFSGSRSDPGEMQSRGLPTSADSPSSQYRSGNRFCYSVKIIEKGRSIRSKHVLADAEAALAAVVKVKMS